MESLESKEVSSLMVNFALPLPSINYLLMILSNIFKGKLTNYTFNSLNILNIFRKF